MDATVTATGFNGSRAELAKFVSIDPRFFYTKAEDMLAGHRDIARRAGPGGALASRVGDGPVSVIGFGSCGGRFAPLLAREHRGVIGGDFVAADDPGAFRGTPPFEVLGDGSPHPGRPLVVVTVGGRAGGDRALRMATALREDWLSEVSAVLVVSFAWEGTRRAQLARTGGAAHEAVRTRRVDRQRVDRRPVHCRARRGVAA